MTYIVQLFTGAAGSVAFGILFHMKKKHLPLAALGGFLGWLVVGSFPTQTWNIWLASAFIGAGVGLFIGLAVGAVEGAIIKRSAKQALRGAALGAGFPAAALYPLSQPAAHQPVALHVLPEPRAGRRRVPDRRRQPGNSGPSARRRSDHPPHRRHPSARHERGRGSRLGSRSAG